jgi:hypothetical protein
VLHGRWVVAEAPSTLAGAVAALDAVLRALEPDRYDAACAARLVELFSRGERLCAAGKALAARRVEETGVWRAEGARSGAHWLAAKSGATVGDAERALRTVRALDALPATEAAFRAGALSATQASEITETAAGAPETEAGLLATASETTVKVLRDECRRRRAESIADDAAWAARLQAGRRLDRWTDPDGMGRGDWKLPPAECARVNRAIDDEIEALWRFARREGRREPRAAYAADALVNLVLRGPTKPPEVKVTIDDSAAARGHVEVGERCEIDGYGPVPVTVARAMMQDASVSVLVRDERDEIAATTRAKRTIPRGLRRRLEHRDPACANQSCRGEGPFEIDHIIPIDAGGRTNDENTWRLCRHCHRLKTYFGWRVRLDTEGRRRLVPP